MINDIVQIFGMAEQLKRMVNAAKFIYGDKWEEKKKETKELIKTYQTAKGLKTDLAAAIQMASLVNDDRHTIVLLAAAADE